LSSILTPFALGTVIGAIAAGRVPVGNAAGDEWSSWTNATAIVIGLLAVATSAYMGAVFLCADTVRHDQHELEAEVRKRGARRGRRHRRARGGGAADRAREGPFAVRGTHARKRARVGDRVARRRRRHLLAVVDAPLRDRAVHVGRRRRGRHRGLGVGAVAL